MASPLSQDMGEGVEMERKKEGESSLEDPYLLVPLNIISPCHQKHYVILGKSLKCVHPTVLFSNMSVRFMFTVCYESQIGPMHLKGPGLVLAQ